MIVPPTSTPWVYSSLTKPEDLCESIPRGARARVDVMVDPLISQDRVRLTAVPAVDSTPTLMPAPLAL